MIVFLLVALLNAALNIGAGDRDLVASAIAYAIAGLLCGLILRTRLEGNVARMLLVCFFGIAFAAGGAWSMVSMGMLPGADALVWGVLGFAASTPYLGSGRLAPSMIATACFGAAAWFAAVIFGEVSWLGVLIVHPVLVCLAAGVFDQLCGLIGLESPQKELGRLRVNLEFRLR
jgi:hypothetical protein